MRGLRPRLVATFALVTAAAAAVLAVTSYLIAREAVLDRAREAAVREGRAVLAEATERLLPDPGPAAVRDLVARLAGRGFEAVAVSADGAAETTSISLSAGSVPAELRGPVAAGRVAAVVTGAGRDAAVVVGGAVPEGPELYLFFALGGVVGDLELVRNVLAGVAVALVAASALVGLAATRGLLRPLHRAREAVGQLESGHLDTRLPVAGRDEFADLAGAFNRMAATLERTVGELRSLEGSHRRFVADVSHELRTPLTALTTAADVLEANAAGLNDPGRRAARLLVVESRRLATLVEDLMEISRLDAGVAAMAWEPVDLGRLVTGALRSRGWAGRVEVDVAPGAATWADPRRVDAVVANVVANALEHGRPPVRVRTWAGAGTVGVEVADAGPGIPPEHLPHLFDRFWKAERSRPRSGSAFGHAAGSSGLGLAIARENARLHGGDLTVASGGGGAGTVFTFVLPRRDGPPVAEPLPGGDTTVTPGAHPPAEGSSRRMS